MTGDAERVALAMVNGERRRWGLPEFSDMSALSPDKAEIWCNYAADALAAMPQPGVRAGLERALGIVDDAPGVYPFDQHNTAVPIPGPAVRDRIANAIRAEIAKLPDTQDETAALRGEVERLRVALAGARPYVSAVALGNAVAAMICDNIDAALASGGEGE